MTVLLLRERDASTFRHAKMSGVPVRRLTLAGSTLSALTDEREVTQLQHPHRTAGTPYIGR